MARIRTIKPSFFRSEDVSVLPLRARLTWIGLWTHCDDAGRAKDNARLIKGDVWPLDDVNLREIEEDLETLAGHGRIVRYEVDGKRYLEIANWRDHQAISKPTASKIPGPGTDRASQPDRPSPPGSGTVPAVLPEDSGNAPGGLPEDSRGERKGREGKGREGDARASANPPAPTVPNFLPPENSNDTHKPNPPQHPEDPPSVTPPGRLDPDEPPPARCPEHIRTLGEVPPCRRCGAAKAERQQWQKHRAAITAETRSRTARERADATRAEIDACTQCNTEGRLIGGMLCDHDAGSADRTRRGAAATRELLRRASSESKERTP